MRKRLISLILVLLILGLTVTAAFAQTYRFQVPREVVNYYINADGTASVAYWIDFTNSPTASPIDFVDVGVPTDNYDLDSITAEIDGRPITDIQRSEYVKPGVALGLGANAIPPGASGQVYVWIPVIREVVYPSDRNGEENYASFQFSPNYFGSEFVSGNTDLTVTLILPPGMTEDQPRYYNPQSWPGNDAPDESGIQDNRVYYTWRSTNADASSRYIFGGGFPKEFVPEDTIRAAPVINLPSFDITNLCCFGFIALFAGFVGLGTYQGRKRKLNYLPPKISVEGHGIKRGLTAVEAAILMQQPMDKIMTMILFSSVKKNAARVDKREPLEISIAVPQPQGLQQYEIDFLQAFKTGDSRERRTRLQDVMVGLVKGVTEKMRGFSRKETIAYYESIIKQAWAQVEAANTPEVKSQKYDEVMDWTMLDKDYGDRTRDVFGGGPVILPRWWGNYDPVFRQTGSSSARPVSSGSGQPSTTVGGGSIQLPTLPGGEFAQSVTNSVQNFSNSVLGDLFGFQSAVSNKTNPPPPPPPRSSFGGGGGGRSCACACACAGCACACAGGGR